MECFCCKIGESFNNMVQQFYFISKLITLFPSELEASKKQAEADKKAIDDLVRERDILNKV